MFDEMKWHNRFMDMANLVAGWSKDPSKQVGAVIVNDNRLVLGLGYNGFPRGCDDHEALYADREVKLSRVIHAELNAIFNANASVRGATLYTTCFTCDRCAAHVVQAGIETVIAPIPPAEDMLDGRSWYASWQAAEKIYAEAGVTALMINAEGNLRPAQWVFKMARNSHKTNLSAVSNL